MISNFAYLTGLIASAIWFSMAFRYFSYQHKAAAKVLIPHGLRDSAIFNTTAASVRFLGGMNGAFAILSILLLFLALTSSGLFAERSERALLLLVLALAHFSQFIFNVPVVLKGGRQADSSYWPVLSGPMLMIFVVDAGETLICLTAALLQFA